MSATPVALAARRATGVGPARRILDIVVSLIVLVLSLPLTLGIALAIRLTSRGPVLFNQTRIGEGYRAFTIHKFRTMAMHNGGAEYTVRNDPRITAVGRYLRGMHLDELPQFINVLAGEMTLVGPRPETPALAKRYPPELRGVLYYRPGMTGPCQVFMKTPQVPAGMDADAFYLNELVPERVALDMEFLENATLGNTLALMMRTLAVILHVREAGPRMQRRSRAA